MFQVRLKVQDLLIQNDRKRSTGFEDFSVSVNEGERFQDLLRRLACENEDLNHMASCALGRDADMPTAIILNGRFLALNEISEVILREGDEVTVLPLLDGG